jgi:hypothetical protein
LDSTRHAILIATLPTETRLGELKEESKCIPIAGYRLRTDCALLHQALNKEFLQ